MTITGPQNDGGVTGMSGTIFTDQVYVGTEMMSNRLTHSTTQAATLKTTAIAHELAHLTTTETTVAETTTTIDEITRPIALLDDVLPSTNENHLSHITGPLEHDPHLSNVNPVLGKENALQL